MTTIVEYAIYLTGAWALLLLCLLLILGTIKAPLVLMERILRNTSGWILIAAYSAWFWRHRNRTPRDRMERMRDQLDQAILGSRSPAPKYERAASARGN